MTTVFESGLLLDEPSEEAEIPKCSYKSSSGDTMDDAAFSNDCYDADVSDLSEGEKKSRNTDEDEMIAITKKVRIFCPEVICFLLELVTGMVRDGHRSGAMSAEYALYKVRRICTPGNVDVLLSSGMLETLISSFLCLTTGPPSLRDEAMRLMVLMARRRMSRKEFRSLLEIFKSESLDMGVKRILLSGLCRVAKHSSSSVQPSYSVVCPPQQLRSKKIVDRIDSDGSMGGRSRSNGSSGREGGGAAGPSRSNFPGLEEGPSASMLKFAIPTYSSFAATAKKGFTVSLWVKLLRPSEQFGLTRILGLSEGSIHVQVSISHTSLVVSVYDSPVHGGPHSKKPGTATFSVAGYLRMPWNQVALAITPRGKFLEVVGMVNGCLLQSLLITLKNRIPSPSDSVERHLYVGSRGEVEPQLEFACAHVFQETLTGIQGGRPVLFLLLVGPEGKLSPNLGDQDLNLRKRELLRFFPEHKTAFCDINLHTMFAALEETLMISFVAKNPTRILIYPKPSDSSNFLSSLVQSNDTSSANEHRIPKAVEAVERPKERTNIQRRNFKFSDLVMEEGGAVTLLLLLARIVEGGASDRDVSAALDLLLTTINSSSEAKKDFLGSDGISLLSRILEDDSCNLGFLSVTTILNHSCTDPILVGVDNPHFNEGANAIIHSPFILSLLVNCWKSLKKGVPPEAAKVLNCSTLREVVLDAFCLLLKNGHEFTKLNMETFRQLNLARTIVNRVQEDFSFPPGLEDRQGEEEEVARRVVAIFSHLAGSPPNMKILSDIMASVLLLVEPDLTFAAHSKSSGFFFNINESLPAQKRQQQQGTSSSLESRPHTSRKERLHQLVVSAGPKRTVGSRLVPSCEDQLIGTVLGELEDAPLSNSQSSYLEKEDLQRTLKQIRERRHSCTKSVQEGEEGVLQTAEGGRSGEGIRYGTFVKPGIKHEIVTDDGSKNIKVVITKEESLEEVGDLVIETSAKDPPGGSSANEAGDSEGNKGGTGSTRTMTPVVAEEKGEEAAEKSKSAIDTFGCSEHNVLEHPGQWGEVVEEKVEFVKIPKMSTCEEIICGLLKILGGLLQNLPDATVPHVVREIILPEHLLILCNHPSDGVREGATWLLWRYVARSSSSASEPGGGRMGRVGGYRLLAQQLHRHPVTDAMVNACLSLVHDRDFNLDESPEIPAHAQVTVRASGMAAVLALLPGACASGDVALAHLLVLHVHELLAKVPGLLRTVLSAGLLESVCKSLRALANADVVCTDIQGQDSRDIIFQVIILTNITIQQLLKALIAKL